jgi:hypothetical protein
LCPDRFLGDADRLALRIWSLLGTGARLAPFALEVVRQQLPDFTPAEWLALADRLALIDGMLPKEEQQTQELLRAMVMGMLRR